MKLIGSLSCGLKRPYYIFGKLLLIFLYLSGNSYANLYKDVSVIRSDTEVLSLKLDIADPVNYLEVDTKDSTFRLTVTVLIGLPYDADAVIESIQGSGIRAVDFIEGFRPKISGSGLAEVAAVKNVRGHRVAMLNIYPLTGDEYYSSANISIRFRKSAIPVQTSFASPNDKIFEAIFARSLVNYDEFKSWSRPERPISAYKTSDHIFGQTDEAWYKITTDREGIFRVRGSDLASAGLQLNNIASDSIYLYYGGGKPLPVQNSDPRPVFREVAIMVNDGGDGIFDSGDDLLFFAEGADLWRFPADSSPVYLNNPYTGENHYWLVVTGDFGPPNRINELDGTPSGTADSIITDSRFYFRVEQNNALAVESDGHVRDFLSWYWSSTEQMTFYINLDNIVPYALAAESTVVRIGARAANSNSALAVNGVSADRISSSSYDAYFVTDQLIPEVLNSFSLSLEGNYGMLPYFDFCEITYPGYFKPKNDRLNFVIEDFTGTGRVEVENDFSANPEIFDISNPDNPQKIYNASITGETIDFEYTFDGQIRRFYIVPETGYLSPAAIGKVEMNNLRDNMHQADLVIVSPADFIAGLEDYADYRRQKSNLSVMLVSFEDILDQFSYGLFDPLAIRDFLGYTYDNYQSPAPSMVLLVGDGTYDYEDNYHTGVVNLIPPIIHAFDNTSSDDNYVYFGDYGILDGDTSYIPAEDRGYDMMISRWPVENQSHIITIVDKVRNYESSVSFGPWRATVTFVSDDEYAQSSYEGLIHTAQTEDLQKNYLPTMYLRNKIYMWEYPINSDRAKPEVNAEIVKSINEGTLAVNYVGHGNPDTWAHEHVFNRGTDLQKLTNADRLALFFAASCSIAFYDNPGGAGMAEDLLRQPGGAIGVVAATRLVYSSENAAFNRQAFDILFNYPELSIGQAIFTAKLLRQYSGTYPQQKVNDRKFAYFGDPAVRLAIPEYRVRFVEFPQEFSALAPHHISGEIVNRSDSSHINFNGNVEIVVYDSEIEKLHRGERESDTLTYTLTGPVIYRGAAEAVDGYFDFSFIAPLDIGYGGTGAKIFSYAMSETTDGLGLLDSIAVSSEITATQDSTGPEITYTFSDRVSFISGDPITTSESLVLNLTDSSGINLTGGSGHRISLTIDNDMENIINLTDLFQYIPGSYTTGSIRYEIDSLDVGMHSFKIKVWDNANNASTAQFDAEVIGSGEFYISDLLNYPNPMEDSTTFSFILTKPARQVSLEIFTLSGKKIYSYIDNSLANDFHRFCTWYGRDIDGDRVATGVYIYKVTASSLSNDEASEKFGKVVVLN